MASALSLFVPLLLLLFSSHYTTAVAATPDIDVSLLAVAASVDDAADSSQQPGLYEPDFGVFDRSIMGRAPPGVTSLSNNAPEQLNVDPGTTQVFVFEKAAIFSRSADGGAAGNEEHHELRRRHNGNSTDDDDDDDDGGGDDGVEDIEDSDDSGSDRPVEEPRLARRQSRTMRTIYLSANTCIQPQRVLSSSSSSAPPSPTSIVEAPQLTMYVSTSPSNIAPGPKGDASKQTVHVFREGAVMVTLNATDDVYIGISAPNVSSRALTGTYNFQVAASVDMAYHSYDNETDANLIWVDSDASAALLITHNLTDSLDADTDAALMAVQPYVMFAQNADDASIDGLRFSYCGLQTYAQVAATKSGGKFTSMVSTSMTKAGLGNLPKQQFYFSGLNASSEYVGILAALPANGTGQIGAALPGAGGKVARATSFATKAANANCEVVFNLTFCNETAYAVPSNPTRFASAAELAQVYDDYASGMFDVFRKVLAQVPCEAPDTQRYSLARNCADCEAAYKNWLCSVAMPRCADFSDDSPWLQPRAISQPFPNGDFLDPAVAAQFPNISAYNASRNPFIDENIAPGPYKEVLPCDDLCYRLVQSCPSAIGFSCPLPGYHGFNTSYGIRTAADENGDVKCNYPGSAHFFSAAPTRHASAWLAAALAAASSAFVVVVL